MRRISFLLIAIAVTIMFILGLSSCNRIDPLIYTLSDDQSYYTVSSVRIFYPENIVVPSEHNGLPVKSIGDSAFSDRCFIETVTVSEGITDIEEKAFWDCISLTDIALGKNVSTIGYNTAKGCSSLRSFTVNAENEHFCSIDGVLYSKDGETLIKYPSGKTNTFFSVPYGVGTIGDYAFYSCEKLVEIVNASSVQFHIEGVEISHTESKIVNKDGYLFYTRNNVNYLMGYAGNSENLSLPEDYFGENYEIYDYAFYKCENIKSITLSRKITAIGSQAFSGCTGLDSIKIPKSAEVIKAYAFLDCSLTVYCEVESQPVRWDDYWADQYMYSMFDTKVDTVWGYS